MSVIKQWLGKISFGQTRYPLPPYGMFRHRDEYVFLDAYGAQWRVRPTCDPSMPLTISMEKPA